MSERNEEDTREYRVVVNDEEQYSLWERDKPLPAGWYERGVTGSRSECLAHIAEVWTDMRPLSLRRRMAQSAGGTEERGGAR
ncbi:MbtH family protein [Streptomyces litchfieldiae]|uniref:MbtH family NRPS accessory protein n=1 Tax=Streptomyces litchfieldiae TaxID=3075543 RepID=A0ABU2MQN9_9ACTN|nr:MbtH family NRPS accessory protein [Streptomyces sp. DSM 44938]MDT0343931.1 MbtH family NRPS accessory protein [Streptomyces sp. DSM 44938]